MVIFRKTFFHLPPASQATLSWPEGNQIGQVSHVLTMGSVGERTHSLKWSG